MKLTTKHAINRPVTFVTNTQEICRPLFCLCVNSLIVNLRNRTGEERRQQALCEKRDNILFEITFRQSSLSFKQIFL